MLKRKINSVIDSIYDGSNVMTMYLFRIREFISRYI